MQSISTWVWQAATVRLGLIALIFVKFSIDALHFCFTCSLKVRQESRCPPKYLISLLHCMGVVLKFRWGESVYFSICLELNIRNSVLSLLSLSCIDVIQLAILVRVFTIVFIVFTSTVWHFAGEDFLMLWLSANQDSVIDDGMGSVMSEQ